MLTYVETCASCCGHDGLLGRHGGEGSSASSENLTEINPIIVKDVKCLLKQPCLIVRRILYHVLINDISS